MNMELDCASTMFVLGRNEERKYLIRLSISLSEAIHKENLQVALLNSVQKFPYFFVRFIEWQNILFAQPINDIPIVREKENITNLDMVNAEECEAQVMCYGRTIMLEYSHAVSDGKGGLEFLLYLTAEYLSLKYHDDAIMRNMPALSVHEQMENGYQVYSHGFRTERTHGTAYKLKGSSNTSFTFISSYCLPVDEIRRRAKRYWVSVTEYIAALLSVAIWNIRDENDAGSVEKIRLSVPVNLRQIFPSHTMRNFSLNVYPEFNPAVDGRELSNICIKFHQYMQKATELSRLAGRCSSSVKLCGFMKKIPLSVKKRIVQTVLNASSTGSSLTFSNMGIVSLPEGMENYVTDMDMLFSAKPEAPYSCSMITVNRKMKITFLRTMKEPLLESAFEKLLRELGVFYVKENVEAVGR